MGPSGSGKTSLMNVLAGRVYSPKMEIQGRLFVNGVLTRDCEPYLAGLGYVMQEDVLPCSLTPR
jgi:ABC-type multidrug transport system ATPase subunit